jgi:hypothetical protein
MRRSSPISNHRLGQTDHQGDVVRKGVLRLLPKGNEAEVARLALERIISDTKNARKPIGP